MQARPDPTAGRPFAACEEALHEAACAATGLDDFGSDAYRDGLRALLHAWDEEADLAPEGRAAAWELVQTALVARLRSQAGWKRRPECLAAEIRAPLFIAGLPRTGSTALQRLLAKDPALQGLELWLMVAPQPRPPRPEWPRHPEFAALDASLRAEFGDRKGLRAIHEMDAREVDECWRLLHQSFASTTFDCVSRVPSYTRWFLDADLCPAYRRHRDQLRLLGARDPGRRWLCKDASHLFAVDAILALHPDAYIVQTHRDPARAIPSVCSLNRVFRLPAARGFDAVEHGAAQLEFWAQGALRSLAARRNADARRFFDVDFRDVEADAFGVVRRLYRHFGLPLSAEAERAMRRHCAENPRGKHGAHAYSAAEFGLDPDRVRERFAAYLAAFPVADPRGA